MFRKFIRKSFKVITFLTISGLLVIILSRLVTNLYGKSRISTAEDSTKSRVAIVFGAGLWWDGSPTPVLRDRVKTAAELFFDGKVEILLMSGDNSHESYNEPQAMKDYALSLGVPETAIVLDYAGRRTYDTCYRARDIFGIKDAILVTQAFHLPRAVYICNPMGVAARGVVADQRQYSQRSVRYWAIRESIATTVAIWEVHVSQPLPILGDPEPMFLDQQPPISYD